ncbi:hypothetical protein L210DRAFT_3645380 [Boletus edulis BED1]|uniref:Uncharacterized protein n=1 Tax=Boletus edulis BED1 TaxID=1328754 RepID=A0AAD4BU24_BOLED|nr:hypothetical protein L210DRAFT_3645380 [Boletus edulis BED1]
MNISGSEGEDNSNSSRILELVILENSNCLPALELESIAVKETTDMSSINWQEVAMEGNDIVQHLRTLEINSDNLGKDTNHSLVCSTPPSLQFTDGSPLTPLPPTPSQPPQAAQLPTHVNPDALANKRVIAMQIILSIEDSLVQAL